LKLYIGEQHPDLLDNILVIAYVRPHIGKVLSAFIERTKAGYTSLDFDQWLDRYVKTGILNYSGRFIGWRNSFGNNFILRPYIHNELYQNDVIADFFAQFIFQNRYIVEKNLDENKKIGLKSLAGLQRFNRLMLKQKVETKQRIKMSLMISRFVRTSSSTRVPQLDDVRIKSIIRACRADANKLDHNFFA
jgi:hypothetical protein